MAYLPACPLPYTAALVASTGFMVGRKSEAGGIAKDGAKMVMAVANAQVRGEGGGLQAGAVSLRMGREMPGSGGVLAVTAQFDVRLFSGAAVTRYRYWAPIPHDNHPNY